MVEILVDSLGILIYDGVTEHALRPRMLRPVHPIINPHFDSAILLEVVK